MGPRTRCVLLSIGRARPSRVADSEGVMPPGIGFGEQDFAEGGSGAGGATFSRRMPQ